MRHWLMGAKAIVMIGEIGGDLEIRAAKWIKENCKKPVVGYRRWDRAERPDHGACGCHRIVPR
jgi:succinyl-CoA synthetase alpha subunit